MFQLAFPSWVKKGSIAGNAEFICAHWEFLQENITLPSVFSPQPEIGLCFFEAAACLDYGPNDLPPALAGLPCSWHVHLPLDIPFCTNAKLTSAVVKESFALCIRLLEKCSFLNVTRAVLHPPAKTVSYANRAEALYLFSELWAGGGSQELPLLVENQPESDLQELSRQIKECRLGACLDLAHLYMNSPKKIDREGLDKFAGLASLWHINAPGPAFKGHSSLTALTSEQEQEYHALFLNLKHENSLTLMLELFKWEDIEQSLPVLLKYLSQA